MQQTQEQSKLVSIIIPIHNSTSYLKRLLTGLLQQTYPHIEILLIDNGSSDDSYAQCQLWAQKDARIRAFHNEDPGTSRARYRGISEAQGDYILFHDHDDCYVNKQAIEHMVSCIEESHADICQFNRIDQLPFRIRITRKFVKEHKIFVRDAQWCENLQGLFFFTRKHGFLTSLWDKIYRSDILKQVLPKYDIQSPMKYLDDTYLNVLAIFGTAVQRVATFPLSFYCWNRGCGFSANWRNEMQMQFDREVFNPLLIESLRREGAPLHLIDEVHQASLYFIRYFVKLQLERHVPRTEILNSIVEMDVLKHVQAAKAHFRARKDGIWDELRFMSSDYTPEEYLEWNRNLNFNAGGGYVQVAHQMLAAFYALKRFFYK